MKFKNFYKIGLSLLTTALVVWNIPKGEAAVLVTSIRNDSILRYDDKTGEFIDTLIPAGSNGLDGPSGMIIGPDGYLYVISIRTDSVLRYDSRTGEFIDTFINNDSEIEFAEDLLFGADGTFYLTSLNPREHGKNSVRRYDGKTGAFIDSFVVPGSGGLNGPLGINFGPDGNFYVTSVFSNQILRYDGKTGDFIDFFVTSGSGGLDSPVESIFGNDGNLYVNSFNGDSILRYDGKTGAFMDAFIAPGLGGLDGPTAIVFVKDVPEPSINSAVSVFALVNIGSVLLYKLRKSNLVK